MRQRRVLTVQEEVPQKPILRSVSRVDMFPKPKEDFKRTQTKTGAVFSLATVIILCTFSLWEIVGYAIGRDAYRTVLAVDKGVSGIVTFNLDITFPRVKCHDLSLDVMDVTGVHHVNVTHDIFKSPTSALGENVFVGEVSYLEREIGSPDYDETKDPSSPKFCGSCFITEKSQTMYNQPGGALHKHLEESHKSTCCNTCDDVMQVYDAHNMRRPPRNEVQQCMYELSETSPGCNVRGKIRMNKAMGRLIFAPRRSAGRVEFKDAFRFNTSHIINSFSIGDSSVSRFSKSGVHFPLQGHSCFTLHFSEIRYFLSIVPTTYSVGGAHENDTHFSPTYEYSSQWRQRSIPLGFGGFAPSVSFTYDFHPIQINNIFERPPFLHFLVKLCGIVGGLFVILGAADSILGWLLKNVAAQSQA